MDKDLFCALFYDHEVRKALIFFTAGLEELNSKVMTLLSPIELLYNGYKIPLVHKSEDRAVSLNRYRDFMTFETIVIEMQ